MNVSYLSSNIASHIASASPLDFVATGAKHLSSSDTVIPPIEQAPEVAKVENSLPSPSEINLSAGYGDNKEVEQTAGQASKDTEKDDVESKKERAELKLEQEEIRDLASRDREVRAHEQAHMAIGGQYAGAAQYQFKRGPDGVSYAISGEVPIDVSKASSPEETIRKAEIVRRAALAPAEPSPQDRRVAAMATRMESDARQELNTQRVDEANNEEQNSSEEQDSQTTATASANDAEAKPNYGATSNFSSGEPPFFINSRLQRGIENASLSSHSPGELLDQIA
ncbi:putative metalloprotease CJM1_0395 family protein [Teredinibacter sp. KSP-S5-2]|uniref:putative metalloprotease CJM1_0395 family protein n=1 Tax=Teredinibacter sp. KSP-S5-2 TaxID=3034506 RepID=UPI002934F4DD|nr:putative metalloprotease CJM1_0395 family protein [Teredinibacter sp. KSP-S5-2]WNO08704.1 putative metalloprotease CJM1_0395 family protein [Teredinibacter sp. KSP-S5-2]